MADQRPAIGSAADVAEAEESRGFKHSNAGKGWLHLGSSVADLQPRMQR